MRADERRLFGGLKEQEHKQDRRPGSQQFGDGWQGLSAPPAAVTSGLGRVWRVPPIGSARAQSRSWADSPWGPEKNLLASGYGVRATAGTQAAWLLGCHSSRGRACLGRGAP